MQVRQSIPNHAANDPRTPAEKRKFPYHVEEANDANWGLYRDGQFTGKTAAKSQDGEAKDKLLQYCHGANIKFAGSLA